MSIEEIQTEIIDLSDEDLVKVIAHAVHVKSLRDPDERKVIQDRMDEKDPDRWLSVEDFNAALEDS